MALLAVLCLVMVLAWQSAFEVQTLVASSPQWLGTYLVLLACLTVPHELLEHWPLGRQASVNEVNRHMAAASKATSPAVILTRPREAQALPETATSSSI